MTLILDKRYTCMRTRMKQMNEIFRNSLNDWCTWKRFTVNIHDEHRNSTKKHITVALLSRRTFYFDGSIRMYTRLLRIVHFQVDVPYEMDFRSFGNKQMKWKKYHIMWTLICETSRGLRLKRFGVIAQRHSSGRQAKHFPRRRQRRRRGLVLKCKRFEVLCALPLTEPVR